MQQCQRFVNCNHKMHFTVREILPHVKTVLAPYMYRQSFLGLLFQPSRSLTMPPTRLLCLGVCFYMFGITVLLAQCPNFSISCPVSTQVSSQTYVTYPSPCLSPMNRAFHETNFLAHCCHSFTEHSSFLVCLFRCLLSSGDLNVPGVQRRGHSSLCSPSTLHIINNNKYTGMKQTSSVKFFLSSCLYSCGTVVFLLFTCWIL